MRSPADVVAQHAAETRRQKFSFRSFLRFYTRFPIPWWLFLLSLLVSLVNTEVMLRTAEYLIQINKGELYNGVLIGYALATVLNAALSMLVNVTNEYGVAKVTFRARRLLWGKILHLSMREVERRGPSALISGVVNDIKEASAVVRITFSVVASLYSLVRCWVEMFRFNSTLSLYMLALIPLALVVFAIVGHLQYQMMRRRYESLSSMTRFFSEHLSAAKHVKAQAIEDLEVEGGFDVINERYRADVYYACMLALQTLTNSLYTTIGTVAIAIFGSDLIRRGQMPQTGINDFSTYRSRVDQYTAEVLTQYQTLKGTQGALQYVGALIDGPVEDPDAGVDLPPADVLETLRLDSVSFGYIPQQPVLHDLSFSIPAGKVTAIIGDNGSGKSTLLKLLQGIYSPDSGRIWLGDVAEDEAKASQLRRRFGVVLQNNPLFSGTIYDNIAYGVEGPVERTRVEQAARLAEAADFIHELPQGYDTEVGVAGSLLSGGQRQRVAIARTLMTAPDFLLLDEAGASLDHRTDRTIFRTIREQFAGRTVVVVAHDMRTVLDADFIVVLHHGALEASGTHDELVRTSPTYRTYLEKQGYALPEEASL